MDILSFLALLIWPLFLAISYFLLRISNLNAWKHSFSQLGSTKKNGKLFNVCLLCVALIESFFLINYIHDYPRVFTFVIRFFFLTSFCGVLVAFIPERKNIIMHRIIVLVGFCSAVAGWGLFIGYLSTNYHPLVMGMLGWTMLFCIVCLKNINVKTLILPAAYESLLFIGALLTNVTILLVSMSNI